MKILTLVSRASPGRRSRLSGLAALVVALAACESTIGSAPFPFQDRGIALKSGPDATTTHDGLAEVARPFMRRAFLRPDVDWSVYDKVLLEPLQISVDYAQRNEERRHEYGGLASFELGDEDIERLRADFRAELVASLEENGSFRVVETPGPGVLRLSSILTELMLNAPTRKSRDVQAMIYTGATSTLTFMADGRDGSTGGVVLRVADTRMPKSDLHLNNATDNRADVRLIFRTWGNALRRNLEKLRRQGVVGVPPS